MAIPPEPIDEIFSRADAAVLAEVVRVLEQGPNKQPPNIDERASDVHSVAGRQVVELKVTGVLFGASVSTGATIKAVKPAGAYALRAGNKGPFLLTGSGEAVEIVGRYGPDTYSEERIREAAKKAGRK
jgi:hypothetical protein